MESRADAGSPATRTELLPGRLVFEQVAMALLADGMVDPGDSERLRFSAETMRHDGNIHPLVLLANLKLKAGIAPMGDLGLERLTEWLAARVGLRYLHVDPTRVDVSSVASLVTHAYARRHRILPLAVEPQRLLVATSEPLALEWVGDVRHMARREVEVVLVNPLDLHRYTMQFFGVIQSVQGARNDARNVRVGSSLPSFEQLVELGRTGDVNADDQHIVHIVDWLLQYAHEQRASDIHLEPRRDVGRVRFRIDGMLHKVFEMPPPVMTAATSRIKVLSRMDLGERRRPQDGRIKTRSPGGREVEMRVSTMPTAFGEKCVLRIFDPDVAFRSIEQLGFSQEEAAGWKELVERPHGIVLVTGPTGSGKTTTLYAALAKLDSASQKIITVEDPVEYQLEGINQIQVHAQINLTFANALRSILRQDPDIIMIGEMRDGETAQIAVQSALTGHLVLSTLHTNTAAGAIIRMQDMGVERYLITSAVNGVLAQRLVRTLCEHCKEPYTMEPALVQSSGLERFCKPGTQMYRPVGCEQCRGSGYKGRTGIHELLVLDESMRKAVLEGRDASVLHGIALQSGMLSLHEDGLRKVAAGVTTLDELARVTQDQSDA